MNRKYYFIPLIIMLFLAACTPAEETTPQSEAAIRAPEAADSETTPETANDDVVVADAAIQGSVELARGACCAGGQAGDTIKVEAGFTAESSDGEIESMRVRTHRASCATEDEMVDSEWEPFTESSSYETVAASGWSSLFVSVQFQDAAGNVSAVFCDDVAVEGMPPLPESN